MNNYRKRLLIATQLCSIVLLTSFAAASARAQTPGAAPANDEGADLIGAPPLASRFALFAPPGFFLIPANSTSTNIDQGVIGEFGKAWRLSGDGASGRESVVLIFRMKDGSYQGRSQGVTNEYEKFTFKWNPAALAVVHTHPNRCDPKPAKEDKRLADKYGVPNFTITVKGMYVYNPATKKTTKVLNGLDWLKLSSYRDGLQRLLEAETTPPSGA